MGDGTIALGRAGHYFTPTSSEGEELAGSCQTATVAYVHTYGVPEPAINIGGHDHNGMPINHTSVPVRAPAIGGASFHLNFDCPWSR